MKQGTIPRHFTRGIVKLLRKNKHDGDGISGRSRPYFQLGHPRDVRILGYRKDMTTQPR